MPEGVQITAADVRQPWMKRDKAVVGCALVLLLTFHLLSNLLWLSADRHSPRSDESIHMQYARNYSVALTPNPERNAIWPFIEAFNLQDVYPPLAHVLGACFILFFGYSVDVIAATGTLLFLAIILGVYVLSREFLDRREALFAAFVASFTPLLYGSSRYFMTDYASAAMAVWAIVCLVKTGGYRRTGWVFGFAVVNGLGLLARPTTVVFLVFPFVLVLGAGLGRVFPLGSERKLDLEALKTLLLNLALTAVVSGGVAAPWYLHHLEHYIEFWTRFNSTGDPVFDADLMAATVRSMMGWAVAGGLLAVGAAFGLRRILRNGAALPRAVRRALAVLACVLLLAVLLVSERGSRSSYFLISGAVFLPMFLLGMGGTVIALFGKRRPTALMVLVAWFAGAYFFMTFVFSFSGARYWIPGTPPFAILAAVALLSIPWPKWRKGAMGAFSAYLLFAYVNLSYAAYGPVARLELPPLARSADSRLAGLAQKRLPVYSDRLHAGGYTFHAPDRREGFSDRILKAMVRDMHERKPIYDDWANYQRFADEDQFEGIWFLEEHYWPRPNRFADPAATDLEVAPRRIRGLGTRWEKSPEDLLEFLPQTDFVVFKAKVRSEKDARAVEAARAKEVAWRAFFGERGFEVIDAFFEPQYNAYWAGFYTVMGRSVVERTLVAQWDFGGEAPEENPWHFAHGEGVSGGILLLTDRNGMGPELTGADLAPDALNTVQVSVKSEWNGSEEGAPVALDRVQLLWTRAGQEEVYSPQRRIAFRLTERGDYDIWEASTKRHGLWNGKIDSIQIAYILPPSVPRDPSVVKGWDFRTLDKSRWEWRFSGGADKAGRRLGALRMTGTDGPGPRIDGLNLAAGDLTHFLIEMNAELKTRSGVRPISFSNVHVYWARSEDVAASGGGWPFNRERSVRLSAMDPAMPTVFVGALASHKDWRGTIEAMTVSLDLPEEQLRKKGGHFGIYTKRIELLRERHAPNGENKARILTRKIAFFK